MRSFFKKPTWANTADTPDDSLECDFYRRSKQTYTDIVAANLLQLEKVTNAPGVASCGVEVKKLDEQNHKPELDENEQEQERPCTPNCSGDPSMGVVDSRQTAKMEEATLPCTDPPRVCFSPASEQAGNMASESGTAAAIITMGSSTHEPLLPTSPTPQASRDDDLTYDQPYPPTDGTQEVCHSSETPANNNHQEEFDDSLLPSPDQIAENSLSHRDSSPDEEKVVQILITSDIRNTKPLLVHRKMSQRLGDVRLAWCERQGFRGDMASSVFLIWKNKRVFDVTTCRSLGIRKLRDSDLAWVSADHDQFGSTGIQIHMEAVTNETMTSRETAAATSPSKNMNEPEKESDKPSEGYMSIVLKNPGLADFRIKVRPTTQISRIISFFRKARGIAPEKQMQLFFDGELLTPDSSLAAHDITHLDLIDVQIK